MVRHRSHSIEFKRQVVQDYLAGETLHSLARRHDLSRNLIRIWIQKFEASAFDDEAAAADNYWITRPVSSESAVKLLIVDELGYVPLSPTGAELLFEVFSQRYERGSTIVTSNLPFEDWTSVLGSERLTGALLDRLTHHVSILAMNGDSYRLRQSAGRRRATAAAEQNQATPDNADPETGEIIP